MRRFRLTSIILFAVLLAASTAGCFVAPGEKNEDQDQDMLLMSMEEFPKLDGSTAALPLGRSLAQHFTGISEADAELLVQFSKTVDALYQLRDGSRDLLITYDYLSSQSPYDPWSPITELECKIIGYDALVFLTHESNRVDNLTQEQLRGIYTGELTDWSEVGGNPGEIIPYQRNEDSGSQILMRSLVMDGHAMTPPPSRYRAGGMEGLITEILDYENDGRAIGYSVYYYASNMYVQPEIKLFAVDGVRPSSETIADGCYPFINPIYAIIRKEEPTGSPARALYDFLSTGEGQSLIREAGYVAGTENIIYTLEDILTGMWQEDGGDGDYYWFERDGTFTYAAGSETSTLVYTAGRWRIAGEELHLSAHRMMVREAEDNMRQLEVPEEERETEKYQVRLDDDVFFRLSIGDISLRRADEYHYGIVNFR